MKKIYVITTAVLTFLSIPLATLAQVKVACIGDSITFGAGIRDRGHNSYPVQLGRILGDKYEVRNYGVNAATLLKRGNKPYWRLGQYKQALEFQPDIVIIKLGTNDTKPGNWQYKAEFTADYVEMIESFKGLASKPTVFACYPVPAFPERWGINDAAITNEVIPLIKQAATQTSVQTIDLHAALSGKGDLFPDKIHPNVKGAGIIADTIANAIRLGPASSKETVMKKTVQELQEEFLDLGFGMFIHYNMATYKNTQWVAGYPDPSTFDPGGPVDTDAWADAAKAAGMKYAVLTAKHVGGFCLWDSEYTTYDVMHPDCPYKQDLVAQFVKSFTSRGLKVGLYYCWRSPGFDDGKNAGKYKVLPPECDPATHSPEEQVAFQKKQIAELVQKFPEVFYIWNDSLDPRIMPAEEATSFIRSLGNNIIASGNWWDWKKKGAPYLDIVVSETRHLGTRHQNNKTIGETCWCLERKWFCSGGPTKDAANILTQLKRANSNRANFLLNVGPDKKGNIHPDSVKVLAEIGKLLTAKPTDGKPE